jgi:hypothetical protein
MSQRSLKLTTQRSSGFIDVREVYEMPDISEILEPDTPVAVCVSPVDVGG